MNISSALIKQCIALADFETWSYLRKEYLPAEYHTLYNQIDKHCENFHEFPSFDDLKLSIRHAPTRDKVHAIESIEIDIDAGTLQEGTFRLASYYKFPEDQAFERPMEFGFTDIIKAKVWQ